ncbi:hypothetical protein Nepgr_007765 [Nepenthes gracilis]|uniref:Uncharacterized protein n=1 Tax=Nepenthes gracilis TaxID=150966 RepID=A0AAD3XIR8_NEPGR|nr:hypothetical protein Nepgr_007765 [Nepenthes gracilis]
MIDPKSKPAKLFRPTGRSLSNSKSSPDQPKTNKEHPVPDAPNTDVPNLPISISFQDSVAEWKGDEDHDLDCLTITFGCNDSIQSPGVDQQLETHNDRAALGKPVHAPPLVEGVLENRSSSVALDAKLVLTPNSITKLSLSLLGTPVSSICSQQWSDRHVLSNQAQEGAHQVSTPSPLEQDETWKPAKSRRHRKSKCSQDSSGKSISRL